MNETIRRIYELQVKLAQDSLNALKQLQNSAASVDKQMKSAGETASGFFKKLAGVITIGAVVASIKGVIDSIDELQKKAEQLSMPVEEFAALAHAANIADVEMSDLSTGLRALEKSIAAFGDKNSKARRVFEALGLDPRGKSITEVLEGIAKGYEKITDPALRGAAAQVLFSRSGLAMIPEALAQGSKGFEKLIEEGKKYTAGIEDAAKAQDDFEKSYKRMNAGIEASKRSFVQGLLPALTSIVTAFNELPGATEGFVNAGKNVGEVLKFIVGLAANVVLRFVSIGKALGALGAAAAALVTGEWGLIPGIFAEASADIDRLAKNYEKFQKTLAATTPVIVDNTKNTKGNAAAQAALAAALANTGKEAEKWKKFLEWEAAEVAKLRTANIESLVKAEEKRAAAIAAITSQATIEKVRALEEQINLLNDALGQEGDKLPAEVYAESVAKLQKEIRALNPMLARLDEIMAQTPTEKTKEFTKSIEALDHAFFDLNESWSRWGEGIEVVTGKVAKAQKPITDIEALLKEIADKVDGYGQRISGLFVDWATGAADAKLSFADFAADVLRQLAQMAVQMLIVDRLMKSFGAALRGWGGGGGIGDTIATAQGAVIDRGNVLPFRRGGVVTRPTVFPMASGMGLMGEAGPEAVMPLKRDAAGNLGVGGGSTVNVTVVNNASGARARTEEERAPDGTVNVRVMIEDVVDTAFKRGRFDSSMREVYGSSRKGRM